MRDNVIQQLSLHLHIGSCSSSKARLKSRFDKGVFDGNGRHTISPRDDDMGQAGALGTESGTQTSRRRSILCAASQAETIVCRSYQVH